MDTFSLQFSRISPVHFVAELARMDRHWSERERGRERVSRRYLYIVLRCLASQSCLRAFQSALEFGEKGKENLFFSPSSVRSNSTSRKCRLPTREIGSKRNKIRAPQTDACTQ